MIMLPAFFAVASLLVCAYMVYEMNRHEGDN